MNTRRYPLEDVKMITKWMEMVFCWVGFSTESTFSPLASMAALEEMFFVGEMGRWTGTEARENICNIEALRLLDWLLVGWKSILHVSFQWCNLFLQLCGLARFKVDALATTLHRKQSKRIEVSEGLMLVSVHCGAPTASKKQTKNRRLWARRLSGSGECHDGFTVSRATRGAWGRSEWRGSVCR